MTTINGYTIVAHEYNIERKMYTILAVASVHGSPWNLTYVTARMDGLTDAEWFWGNYHTTFERAVESYNRRKAL